MSGSGDGGGCGLLQLANLRKTSFQRLALIPVFSQKFLRLVIRALVPP